MGRPINEIDKEDEKSQGEQRKKDAAMGEVFFGDGSIDVDNVLDDNG